MAVKTASLPEVDWNSTAESLFHENYTTTPDYDIIIDPPLEELIPVSVVYGCTLVLGILGNGLVIFSVSRYEQMMTITNTFLLSLASADMLLVLVCVPVKVGLFTAFSCSYDTNVRKCLRSSMLITKVQLILRMPV